jgi:hypothetical protein
VEDEELGTGDGRGRGGQGETEKVRTNRESDYPMGPHGANPRPAPPRSTHRG